MLKSIRWVGIHLQDVEIIDDEFEETFQTISIWKAVVLAYSQRNKNVALNLMLAAKLWHEKHPYFTHRTMITSCTSFLAREPNCAKYKKDFDKYLTLC